MSRYIGPKFKVIRLLGNLPGLTRNNIKNEKMKGVIHEYKKESPYSLRLKEKQKLKYNYGISEKQLKNYMIRAKKMKGIPGETILQLLEMRLDSILFQTGFAPTILAARQIIRHGHMKINDKIVSMPNYQCQPGNVLSIKENSNLKRIIHSNYDKYLEAEKDLHIKNLSHLNIDKQKLEVSILQCIDRNQMQLKINEFLVIEFYSRKI